MKRRKTRSIKIGGVKIGSRHPVSVQSMTNTPTSDAAATVRQIKRLAKAGCQIVRVAVRHKEDAKAIAKIKPKISLPIEADIHFSHSLALESMANGVDAVRLNPGNINNRKDWVFVARCALKKKIPIRVGVNAGSLSGKDAHRHCKPDDLTARQMVAAASKYIKWLEKEGFYDINVSLKASSVMATMQAYRCMAEKCDYPFHLGITAAGPLDTSLIKSSVGIGGLLSEGIGDTIRVSLTGAPEKEITVAKNILYSLGLVRPAIEIISCPTCGRCELDLEKMVKDIRKRIDKMMPLINFPPPEKQQPIPGKNRQTGLKIAVMGCVVNGPGEASEADIGVAGGRNCGVLFKNGKRLRKVKQINIIPALMKEIRELCKK